MNLVSKSPADVAVGDTIVKSSVLDGVTVERLLVTELLGETTLHGIDFIVWVGDHSGNVTVPVKGMRLMERVDVPVTVIPAASA